MAAVEDAHRGGLFKEHWAETENRKVRD